MDITDIITNLWNALFEIINSMFSDLSIWWLLGPVIFFWFVFEVYFSIHKKEKLGWNTALGNGLSVFWVIIVCMKFLFDNDMENFVMSKFIALIVILIYSIFIIIDSFWHKIGEKISFGLAAPVVTYYLSGVAILWTFGKLDIDLWVLVDLIIGYILASLVGLMLKKLIKEKAGEDLNLEGTGFEETELEDINQGNMGGF